MCPATHASALGGTPAANDADGRHIRKVAGWVHVFDALMSAAQLVPTEDCNHAGNGEPKALIALGTTSEERCGDGDCQCEGADSSTNEQQQRKEIRFVAHEVLRLSRYWLQLGPDRLEGIGEHLLPGYLALRFALDGDGQLCADRLVAVGRVLEMETRRVALLCEGLALLHIERKDVGSEVHTQSTPCSCRLVNTV